MASSDQPTSLLPRPDTQLTGWETVSRDFGDWTEGQRVGSFRLVRRLGKGGMGQVWLAHQLHPLIRDVALKVMLPERRSARAEAFFEVERQALAQLSHRAIAQIFDAGRLPDGALFFAMEYVPGLPLNEYLREHPQPLACVVRMFIELCGGIQHAHQRGLIHRDLKPQNVLVQDTEAGPLPRIIDFGIALGTSADGPTLMQPHQIAGTPAYMSPEQRRPGELGIDARSDIYALGVMLAECLRRQVGLSTDNQGPESTGLRDEFAQSLGTRPTSGSPAAQLKRAPFELRAIALKALAEDREQRYASAASMAEDLQRWLQREPVVACGGGRGYVLRCFLRRNALAAAAASLIGFALIGGTGLALYGLTEARTGRTQAEAAQGLAEQRRGEAEQLIQYMLGDFADKLRPLGRLDLLDSIGSEALKYLGEADGRGNAASHLARARALRTLGEVQVTRQQFEQATPILQQAARLLDEAMATPGDQDEELHFEAGQVAYWRGLIAYRQRDHQAAEAHWGRYLSEARAFDELTDDHTQGQQEIAYALNNLGSLMLSQGNAGDALANFRQAADIRRNLHLAENDPRTLELADTFSWIGNAQERLGRPTESMESLHEALEVVLKHRQAAGETARTRQLEVNLRLLIAEFETDANSDQQSAENLLAALELADIEVSNDPTRPRRQALLARTAFLLAKSGKEIDAHLRTQIFRKGDIARNAVEASNLSENEKLLITAQRCLAFIEIEPSQLECLTEAGERLHSNALGSEFRLAEALILLEISAHPRLPDRALALDVEENIHKAPDEVLNNFRVQRKLRELRHSLNPDEIASEDFHFTASTKHPSTLAQPPERTP